MSDNIVRVLNVTQAELEELGEALGEMAVDLNRRYDIAIEMGYGVRKQALGNRLKTVNELLRRLTS